MIAATEARPRGAGSEIRVVESGGCPAHQPQGESLDASGLSFLVVDDEESILRMVSSALTGRSGKVVSAPDGAAAREFLQRHQPDILISDIRMPGMDGLALLAHARSVAPETEVVLITGFADKDVVIEALRAGASSFLEKPFGARSLLGHLQPLVDRIRIKRENERLREEREREREQREEQGRLAAMGRVLAGLAREILVPLDLACQGVEMARYEVARLENAQEDAPASGGPADEWLADVGRCVKSIQDKVLVIEQFLDPSRPCRPVATSVAEALSRVVQAEGHRPESATVEMDIEDGLEVVCDPVDLATCLSRIISNAYEALAHEGSRLALSARRVPSRTPQVEIRFADDGPGMSPELLARVLVPFFSTRPDAMGFGLPIAFEAARRNGGVLAVESAEGEGTTVTLTLPAREAEVSAARMETTPKGGHFLKTLIVEDDFVSRRVIQAILAPLGPCEVAVNGHEALEAFRLARLEGAPYDLVCLDIMMPEVDGMETLRRIREMEKEAGVEGLAGVKVIMTTALSDFESIMSSFRNQCEAYLVKPISRPALLDKVREIGLQT